jgi:hypothetical protein
MGFPPPYSSSCAASDDDEVTRKSYATARQVGFLQGKEHLHGGRFRELNVMPSEGSPAAQILLA